MFIEELNDCNGQCATVNDKVIQTDHKGRYVVHICDDSVMLTSRLWLPNLSLGVGKPTI